MNDEKREQTDREETAQLFERLSLELQERILQILNDDAAGPNGRGWSSVPHVVGHALGMLLGNVLRASLLGGACTERYAVSVIDGVRTLAQQAVLEAMPEPGPGARYH